MENSIITALGSAIPGLIFVFFIGFAAIYAKKSLFKKLRLKFETKEEMPGKGFRIGNFWYGRGREYHGAFRLTEKGQALFMHCPSLRFTLKIPFSEIASASAKNTLFGRVMVKLKFKTDSLKPIAMSFSQKHLSELPHFVKFSGADIEVASKQATGGVGSAIQLKNTPTDIARKIILTVVIVGAAIGLYIYYV